MPTKSRRLLITPTPELWTVLDKFHEITGRSRASVAVEFLGTVAEQMAQIVDILAKVRGLEGEALEDVRRVSQAAMQRLEGLASDASAELDLLADTAAAEPPSSNTGVTNPRKVPPSPRKRAA